MITLIFTFLLIAFIGKIAMLAIRAAWGLTKVLFTIVLFPLVLVGMALSGFVVLAIIALIIGGLIALTVSAVA